MKSIIILAIASLAVALPQRGGRGGGGGGGPRGGGGGGPRGGYGGGPRGKVILHLIAFLFH